MFVLNGNSKRVLKMLKTGGLTEYESKAFFTLRLTGELGMWELSKRSSVPQSKIYMVADSLQQKGLVDVSEERPKTITPRSLKRYLRSRICEKRREVQRLESLEMELSEISEGLKPITSRFKSYRVFEPKYRRKPSKFQHQPNFSLRVRSTCLARSDISIPITFRPLFSNRLTNSLSWVTITESEFFSA